MASTTTTIDVDDFENIDTKDGGADLLHFQDIVHDTKDKGDTHHFTDFPHSAADSDDEGGDDAKLLEKERSSAAFWTFAYYQQFFDVESRQVGMRIVGSMLPRPGQNYLVKQIRPNPDLYGPFWVCTTLVFTTAIAGNLANYFSLAGKDYHWKYDFHKVTLAASAIFSYWWLIPLCLFGVVYWRGNKAKLTFLEILCVYGYSLAIYVPISVLWAIQVSWLQWTLVVLGACLSGSVLLITFWPAVSEDNKKIALGLMIFIFIMHAALAVGFVLYFFHVPVATSSTPDVITNTTTAAPIASINIGRNLSTAAQVVRKSHRASNQNKEPPPEQGLNASSTKLSSHNKESLPDQALSVNQEGTLVNGSISNSISATKVDQSFHQSSVVNPVSSSAVVT